MNKSIVLQRLQQHIQDELKAVKISKKDSDFLSKLRNATEDDISFGKAPNYFFAYMKCNSTGVGTSSFEGTKTQRTVALDYTTDQYLFIDGHEKTAVKGLELFFLKPGEVVNYYKKEDMEKTADSYGRKLHKQEFDDLNFYLKSHRVNRYNATITKGPFTYPIYPIYASVMGIEYSVVIGYLYEKDGQENVIIDLKEATTSHKKGALFSPWMLFGLICPPVLIVAIGVVLYKIINSKD